MFCENIKGEAFKYMLRDYFYIELIDKKEKVKRLERRHTKINKPNYNKWLDNKVWEQFIENYGGTKTYDKVKNEIFHYEFITRILEELYKVGMTALQIHKTNEDIEFIVNFLKENNIKIKVFSKRQPQHDINIAKVDVNKHRDKLIQVYNDIIEEKIFKITDKRIKEKILICLKDIINYGYGLMHDGLESGLLKYYRAPKLQDRPSIANILKKYRISFKIDIVEGIKGYFKRLYLNYKVKLIQVIKRCKKIANFSGGKDSAYMILKGLEEGIKFDYIIFADTELEYPEMYAYIDKFEQYIKQKIIMLKPKISFNDWFYKPFAYGKNEGKIHGFPYVVGDGCWAKRELKIKSIETFKKTISEPCVDYIGIAADELERYKKLNLEKQQAPLVDWGITEEQCKSELDNIGLLNPLYCKFKRLGCWLCPKQNLDSLKALYKDYPDLWEKLKEYQKHDFKPFKPNISVEDIEKRFLLNY